MSVHESHAFKDLRPCPLCGLYDFMETQAGALLPDMSFVSAYVFCADCSIQVNGETLDDAIRKWNEVSKFLPHNPFFNGHTPCERPWG